MKDYLVRGLVNSKNCRVFACQTTNLLEKARQEHDLWPTASAALGRMMSATLMMAAMNKNNEKMTVTINGGGPIGTMMAVTRGDGHIKGFVGDPHVHYTYNDTGHLAVGVAVGTQGTLQVIKENEEKTKEEQEYNQLLVPAGKRARVELSDGTRLVVNSQSKVIYPRCFKGDIRKIYAQGEVFLEVAHDKKHPFIVESDDFKLQVLGTKFNISNYKGGTTNIVLVEGAVEVTDKNEKKARLNPNDLLNIANGTIAYQKQVDVAEYISWVEGIMLLNGNDLSQIIQRLSIYYGISIQCDPIIGKEKVYGKLDLKDDIDEVIECIQQTLPFTIGKAVSLVV